MFDGSDFPKSLDESVFESWLESGRQSKLGYQFLLIVWDEVESAYTPVYAEERDAIKKYGLYGRSAHRESLVAAYDLYSESKVW